MAKTYADFKTWLQTFLWKSQDAVLIANLDSLITMANAEIKRKLDIKSREITVEYLSNSETVATSLVTDMNNYDRIISITDNKTAGRKEKIFKATTVQHILELRALAPNEMHYYYAISSTINDTDDEPTPEMRLLFATNWTVSDPADISIHYRRGIPDYAVLDYSWVEDTYLDYYTYTVLSHCAAFLREDARIATWKDMRDDALASILEDDKHYNAFGGGPLHMKPVRAVP